MIRFLLGTILYIVWIVLSFGTGLVPDIFIDSTSYVTAALVSLAENVCRAATLNAAVVLSFSLLHRNSTFFIYNYANEQEEEQSRVDKELANIRSKFSPKGGKMADDGSNPSLSSYQRKKYVWKLVYIHVLGYDVDFGHAEVLVLIRSPKYSEKHVGYTALSLLLRGDDPMMGSIRSTIVKDLTVPTPADGKKNAPTDASQSLALCSIANIIGLELIQSVQTEVLQTLVAKSSSPCVKKKAALCLLRLVRTNPKVVNGHEFAPQMAQLLQDRHLGVLTSAMSLLYGLASQGPNDYESLIPYAVHIMGMLVLKKACAREYLYYRTPSPWLQIKLLKFLQLYPHALGKGENGDKETAPGSNAAHIPQLTTIITKILSETDVSDSINKSNADHAVLFEAVNLDRKSVV